MQECNICLKSESFWIPQLARHNDQFLMDAAIITNCGLKELQIINNWRVYFKALRLSDICDGYGKQILLPYRKYTASSQWKVTRDSNLNWPKQAHPNKTSFNVWCKFLKSAFQMQNSGYINIKLEDWKLLVNASDTRWSLYYYPVNKTVYKTTMTFYEIYKQQSISRLKGTYSSTIIEYDVLLPEGCIPATHIRTDNNLVLFNFYGENDACQIRPLPETVDNFQGYISNQPQWAKDLSSNWSSSSREEIIHVIRNETSPIFIAVDSKVNRHFGNYAVVIGSEHQIVFENKGRVLQTQEMVQSIRMQWIGVLSAVINIKFLYQYFNIENIQDRGCQIFCRNQTIAKILQKYKTEGFSIGRYGLPHIDVILQILEEINNVQQLQVQIDVHFLQQQKTSKDEIPQPPKSFPEVLQQRAKHNVIKATKQHFAAHDIIYMYPASKLQVYIKQQPIYNNIYRKIGTAYTSQALITYMLQKYNWSRIIFDKVWWKIHGEALQINKPATRHIINKFLFDQWATNTREFHIHPYRSKTCERCGIDEETTDHVLKCPSEQQSIANRLFIQEVQDYLHDSS